MPYRQGNRRPLPNQGHSPLAATTWDPEVDALCLPCSGPEEQVLPGTSCPWG